MACRRFRLARRMSVCQIGEALLYGRLVVPKHDGVLTFRPAGHCTRCGWKGFPPVNTQGSEFAVGRSGYGTVSGVRAGGERLTGEQIVEQHGAWLPPARPQDVAWAKMPVEQILLANPKLQLVYSCSTCISCKPRPNEFSAITTTRTRWTSPTWRPWPATAA